MNSKANPFPRTDSDRSAIWEILVTRDFEAFIAQDWSLTGPDFSADGFFGIDAHHSLDPAKWTITFPTLNVYRDDWLRQAAEYSKKHLLGIRSLDFLYDICQLDMIEIAGDRALAHKKFKGSAPIKDGGTYSVSFQSMYKMVRRDGKWRVVGFVGYLPLNAS